jgi:hypothetical protein
MRASCSLELNQAFILDADAFKKLCKLLDERMGHLEISGECADQVRREFKDAADLVKYENTKGKDILRISISARSDNHDKSSQVKFSGTYSLGISININANDDVLTRLRSDILDIVSGTKPWFSMIACVDFALCVLITFYFIFGIGLVTTSIMVLRIPKVANNIADSHGVAIGYLVPIVFIVSFAIIGWLIYHLRKFVFPRSVFLIGQGKNRYRIIELFQWGVFIAFLVSFAAGIALLVFTALFK